MPLWPIEPTLRELGDALLLRFDLQLADDYDLIFHKNETFTGTLTTDTLTASRTWTLPDATGTIGVVGDLTWSEVLTGGATSGGTNAQMTTNDELQFRATTQYINSQAAGYLDYTALTSHRFRMNGADTDVLMEFIGTTNSGQFKWMEDEDRFEFLDEVYFNGISIALTSQATVTPTGTTQTITWSSGNFATCDFGSATGDVTFTFSGAVADGVSPYILKLIQGATARQPVWPGTVKWTNGAPYFSTTNDAEAIATFLYDGTNYYGTFRNY